MADEKKTLSKEEPLKEKELNLEELKDVSGGALKDVVFTKTSDISLDTKNKIG